MTNPTLTRRALIQRGALATAGAASLAVLEEGCALPNWVDTIINDIPTALQIALQIYNVIGLYTASGVDPAVVAKMESIATEVKDGLTSIVTWAKQFSTTPSVLGDIYNALTVVQNNLTTILSTLHVYNNEYTTALGVGVAAALAIITAIQNIVPLPTPAPVTATAKVIAARTAIKTSHGTDHSLTIKSFYNEAMVAGGGSKFVI